MCAEYVLSILKSVFLLATVSRKPFSIINSELPLVVNEGLDWNLKYEGFSALFSLKLIDDVICGEGLENDNITFLQKLL